MNLQEKQEDGISGTRTLNCHSQKSFAACAMDKNRYFFLLFFSFIIR